MIIEVCDEFGISECRDALIELGFSFHDARAFKICLPGVWQFQNALTAANEMSLENGVPENLLGSHLPSGENLDPHFYLKLEHRIWPGKIDTGERVACLTIPIRPRWARALFDPNLGQQEFWDEDANLLLNPTNAYYTGARPSMEYGRDSLVRELGRSISGIKAGAGVLADDQTCHRPAVTILPRVPAFRSLPVVGY